MDRITARRSAPAGINRNDTGDSQSRRRPGAPTPIHRVVEPDTGTLGSGGSPAPRQFCFGVEKRSERRGIQTRANRDDTRQPGRDGGQDRQNDRMKKHCSLEQADGQRHETGADRAGNPPPLGSAKQKPDPDTDERERISRLDPRSRGRVRIKRETEQDQNRSRGRHHGETRRCRTNQIATAQQQRRGAGAEQTRECDEPRPQRRRGEALQLAPKMRSPPIDDHRNAPHAAAHALRKPCTRASCHTTDRRPDECRQRGVGRQHPIRFLAPDHQRPRSETRR